VSKSTRVVVEVLSPSAVYITQLFTHNKRQWRTDGRMDSSWTGIYVGRIISARFRERMHSTRSRTEVIRYTLAALC